MAHVFANVFCRLRPFVPSSLRPFAVPRRYKLFIRQSLGLQSDASVSLVQRWLSCEDGGGRVLRGGRGNQAWREAGYTDFASDGYPLWPQVYYLLRCGDYGEAEQILTTANVGKTDKVREGGGVLQLHVECSVATRTRHWYM